MENSLSPAFVKIEYTSRWAPHTMTIPSVPLNNMGVVDTAPNFDLRGAEIDVGVDGAINDFVDLLLPLFLPSTTFNSYTVYSQPGVGDIPAPVWSAAINKIGTSVKTTLDKAMEQIYTFRADDFGLYKLYLLDVPSEFNQDRVTSLGSRPAHQAIVTYITALETWFAARSGGRPAVFMQVTEKQNDKLRRSYRMT
jgi:hypothetical protein